ncbi:SpoIIE family protein phosphatase [Rubinisphaera brasiliensis]|uniref:Protein serine/threonine phosphatase with GAF(S) sensor(S) n=1 Tax=Rubinisphaera brasiliensis (strain ATCC 49424 / DSM 5305 / JCM 21570 / IAM 15109 / NBRC 103401 / IFAM 1448) TaxID=756272 RepID=F0SM42_RUBBR|nr:SpoIIE family protein phosphatase [Rubinisphaera brasiliensis]ADY60997.1 protein serine/threonine phosphatase with GAF(s) sensor(s) [Rubinisphaera brasiliensis DSM 5305]
MPRLMILQGGQAIPRDITQPETVLGRLPECDVQLDSNMVSRRHAKLCQQGESYLIEDLGSGNGTFVNGKRIEGQTALKHGDRLKLGPILLRFESASAPSGPDATAADDDLSDFGQFTIDVSGENGTNTIMGVAENASGFGMLDVHPEAKLKAIIEISRSLAGTVDLDNLLPKILDTLFGIFPHADRGCILLKDEQSGQMVPRAIKHRKPTEDDSVKLSRTILNSVLEERKGILSADATSDARFEASESISNLTIRSMMCVPLLNQQGEPMGVINIDTQNPISQFRQEDLDLLLAVAGQAALSYETAKLMASYAEKQKQDSEMRIAANVQHALLPECFPELEGYEFYASYEAAQAVGGDYYDVIRLDDDRICVAFGDVAGKGVPAALVMSRLSSVVRSTMAFVQDVAVAAAEINNHMCAKAVEGRFVTFVLIVLNGKTNEISVVNAGHMSPMFRKADGSVEEFDEETVGLPIGVLEDFEYEEVKHTISPGEIVTIYTDGVSEAMNFENDLYGIEQIKKIVSGTTGSAADVGEAVLKDVKRHADGRPQNDDITLLSFGRC